MEEHTTNGIMYTWELAGSAGASFLLFPDPNRDSQEKIEIAKAEIYRNQDVVYMRIATEEDRDQMYKTLIFRDPRTKALAWYEIEQDAKLLHKARIKGISPAEFVTAHVLPFTDEVKERNFKAHGKAIFEM